MKKILILGATIFCFLNLANAQAGELDSSFGTNGIVRTIGASSTTVQKDGKIITAGSIRNGSSWEFVIARYNTNGSLDSMFSGDGIITTGIPSNPIYGDDYKAILSNILIQSDGKIVVAGGYAVARYNTDGSIDNTFSNDGKLTTDSIVDIRAIAIQSDGKIVAAGEVKFNPSVTRYNTDGSLDKTFGVNGKQTFEFNEDYGYFSSIVIQNNGKIVAAGAIRDESVYSGSIILARLNTDGSRDSTFGHNGEVFPYISATVNIGGTSRSVSVIAQNDGKIIAAGSAAPHGNRYVSISRFKIDGSIDSSFNAYGGGENNDTHENTSIALQNDGKIVVSGVYLSRFNTDGSHDTTFNTNATQKVDFIINDIAISGNKLYAVGGFYGAMARYFLDNGNNTPPTASLTAPANNATYLAPAAHIRFFAVAADKDGTISKVEFYNGTKLLHTETVFPYGFTWRNVGLGNYTLTAKAYDNSGLATTSAPVHIFVVPNKPPVVSITKPVNNRSFAAPGYIHLEAAASDTDGRITNVKFYNGTTLLRTEYEFPYTYHWENVPAGTYTITAAATDNWGAHTTSAPVTIRVTSANAMIVSSKPVNTKTGMSEEISLKLSPNPATNIVNIYKSGLQQSKPATISIISVSGIVFKTVQTNNSTTQLDVSSLVSGVYTLKIVSGDKVMYKQFVKL